MQVVIRADASGKIGTGHVMRCLTLADTLSASGSEIVFVCREHAGSLCDLIEAQGYTVLRLTSRADNLEALNWNPHAKWLGVSWEQDAAETTQAMQAIDQEIDWFIVDHYALDGNWEKMFRTVVGNIMVIDDLADRSHDCDVLLDQNLYEDIENRYNGLVPRDCKKLFGPKYALLRPEFQEARKQLGKRDGKVQRILISLGGVDADNYTERFVKEIFSITSDKLSVDVVIGEKHPCREQIESCCNQYGYSCHIQTSKMAELMMSADIGIGAGGATSWERCCLGLPSIIVSLADNQIEIAKALHEYGACLYLGMADKISLSDMSNVLSNLVNYPEQLLSLYEKSYSLVDGLGATRVCEVLR